MASEALASIVLVVVMIETMRQTSFKQHLLWLLRCKQRRLCRWLADASFGLRASGWWGRLGRHGAAWYGHRFHKDDVENMRAAMTVDTQVSSRR